MLKFLPLFFSTLGILGIFLRSICPKGWQLPQNSTTVGTKSYSNLLFQAGVIGKISDDSTYVDGGFEKLTGYPMSFLRAGYHNTTGRSVSARGSGGYCWSKSSSSTGAYNLFFASSSVRPRLNDTKASGVAVRCVAL